MTKIPEKRALELLAVAKARCEDAKMAVRDRIDLWLERLAFMRGWQYAVRDGAFVVDDDASGEEREVHNYIGTFVRSAVANRLKTFPNPQVPASSGDQRSMAKADATEKLLASFIDDEIVSKEEIIRALTWAAAVGGAWVKCYWDPHAGRPLLEEPSFIERHETDPETGETVVQYERETDEFGVEIFSRDFEGSIRTEFVDTIDALPDPTAKRGSEMRFWIHRKLRPVSELEAKFPVDYAGKKTKGRFDVGGKEVGQAERDMVGGAESMSVEQRHDNESRLAHLYEYWEPASPERPNGMFLAWSNDVIVAIGANPYRPARIPAVLFLGDNLVPSGLYADGVVEPLIPLQRTLNSHESMKKEWIKALYSPKILNPIGSMVVADDFGDLPSVIDHAPGLKPSPMQVPDMPSAMFEAAAELVSRMKEISSYSDISRGDVPQGVESGRAIAFLRENEQTIREPDMLLHRSACLSILRHCLWLAKQFYHEDRAIRTMGDDGWEYFIFKADDFDWYADLAPEAFSGAPNSRALRWAETVEAFTAGLFDDENPAAKKARRMLELDHANRSTVDPDRTSRRLARMENLQAIELAAGRGQWINEVREFHDDKLHLEEHNVVRNSPIYLAWPHEVQAAFDHHCENHEGNLEAKEGLVAGQQDPAAMNAKPGPPPAPMGAESPMAGGHSVGEAEPASQDEFLSGRAS